MAKIKITPLKCPMPKQKPKEVNCRKLLKRTCVLVDPDTWEEFKRYAQGYGISASAQINIFINKFIQKEQRRKR